MISAEPPVRARRPLGQYSNNTPRTLFGKTSNRSGSASQSPGPACAPMRGGRQPCASAAELSTTMVFAHHRRSSEAQSPCLKCKPAAIRVPRGSARVLYCAVARTLHTMIMRELSQKNLCTCCAIGPSSFHRVAYYGCVAAALPVAQGAMSRAHAGAWEFLWHEISRKLTNSICVCAPRTIHYLVQKHGTRGRMDT